MKLPSFFNINIFNIFLVMMLMLSSISLVTARHKLRQLFIEYESSQSKTLELEISWRHLQLNRAQHSTNFLVDQAAKNLNMIDSSPERTIYLNEEYLR